MFFAMINKVKFLTKSFFVLFAVGLITALPVDGAVLAANAGLVYRDKSYTGKYASQSIPDPIVMEAGTMQTVWVKIKNTGSGTWNLGGKNYVSVYTVSPSYRKSVFAGPEWLERDQPAQIWATTKPGKVAQFKIKLHAPAKIGTYTENFNLSVENETWIKGAAFSLKIKVIKAREAILPVVSSTPEVATSSLDTTTVDDVSAAVSSTTSTSPADTITTTDNTIPDRELISEPNIRVKLYETTKEVQFKSDFDYEVFLGENSVGILPADTLVKLTYTKGVYHLASKELTTSTKEVVRLAPADPNNYFTLVNYDRKVNWKGKTNFNVYRGTFEYRYSVKQKINYVINELPLDEYTAGIGETGNDTPTEYMRALIVAARSYAYALIHPNGPDDKSLFDVYATTADQLYLGYNSEKITPRLAQAAADTRGEMVTYNSQPVITYYYSNSDGNTRSWEDIWGNSDRPWLQSVECVYDYGMHMYGHGVGMSNHDAIEHALKDGWTYDQILKYYYTSTTLEKIY